MLGDGVDLEDVRAVEIVEDAALDEDVLKVFVRVELAEEEFVDCAFLGDVILELVPFGEPMLGLLHRGFGDVRVARSPSRRSRRSPLR